MSFSQSIFSPVIAEGAVGTSSAETPIEVAKLVPHMLEAVTVMFPPEEPAVALIVLDVELPDQPDGNVQL